MTAQNRILPLLETYKGRDKFLRLLCYSTKCSAGLIKSSETASKFDRFSKQLSTSRACFRLLDDIPTIAEIIRSKPHRKDENIVDKIVLTAENIVDLIFSPLDHISWAIEHKIIVSNSTVWDTASTWCWVISLYINIYKNIVKLSKLSQEKLRISMQPKERELKKKLSIKQWYLEMSTLKCALDLLFAVNYLPRGLLWAKFFSKWQKPKLSESENEQTPKEQATTCDLEEQVSRQVNAGLNFTNFFVLTSFSWLAWLKLKILNQDKK